ncbi:MAG: hypothetical protein ACTHQQ_21660 [Solirubrobacteraceae bacterium]
MYPQAYREKRKRIRESKRRYHPPRFDRLRPDVREFEERCYVEWCEIAALNLALEQEPTLECPEAERT